mmetsp:Transcript_69918/g.149677  ORF Transcript_69918/g.149677 Transcript_69918/m.149677 type:complete len:240 (-) Transcript_69918:327-1046(-)
MRAAACASCCCPCHLLATCVGLWPQTAVLFAPSTRPPEWRWSWETFVSTATVSRCAASSPFSQSSRMQRSCSPDSRVRSLGATLSSRRWPTRPRLRLLPKRRKRVLPPPVLTSTSTSMAPPGPLCQMCRHQRGRFRCHCHQGRPRAQDAAPAAVPPYCGACCRAISARQTGPPRKRLTCHWPSPDLRAPVATRSHCKQAPAAPMSRLPPRWTTQRASWGASKSSPTLLRPGLILRRAST